MSGTGRYLLLGISTAFARKRYPVHSSLVLGRDASCKIVLSADDVSGRHAALRPTAHGVVIVDLDSIHGVFINDRRARIGILLLGDELGVARHRFLLGLAE